MKPRYEVLDKHRITSGHFATKPGQDFGAFEIPGPNGRTLRVISSGTQDGTGWEHVSVSLTTRCPNWPEMCCVKDLFWGEDETVIQLHPPKAEYVNMHEFCLHLWKPENVKIATPPQALVGVR